MKKIVCMLILLSALANFPSFAGDRVTVMVGYENNPGEPIDLACREWQRLLHERSGGSMQIDLYPSSQLGSKDNLIDQMLAGESVVTLINGGIYSDRGVRDFGIVFAPYLFASWEEMDKLVASGWWKEQEKACETIGLKVLASNWRYGARHTLTKRKVETPADLVGMKIRVPNNTYQVKGFLAMGAVPTPMALSEVYTSLQQGVIDGLENPLPVLYNGKFQEVAKYLILDGHILDQTTWATGTLFFDTLSSEQQKMLIDTGIEAGVYNNNELDRFTADTLEQLKREGVEVVPIDHEAFKEAAASFYADSAILGNWSPNLIETIRKAIE